EDCRQKKRLLFSFDPLTLTQPPRHPSPNGTRSDRIGQGGAQGRHRRGTTRGRTMARQDALIRLHKNLLARRAEMLRKLDDDMQDLRGGVAGSGDAADVAFEATGDEMASHLAELDARELGQIERALIRLKQGTYGVCESCAQKIPVGRLNALPYSTLCIDCQREMEQYPDWGRPGSSASWARVSDSSSTEDHREFRLSDLEIDLSK